ncbi:type II toxin-antitoxin system ParD family antitoxin [Candidatus Woesebacteria bacterium]|nr:type II toxin-antitoxin system ParD family antitoxin [Candidatus Woesebacteria bacterium]
MSTKPISITLPEELLAKINGQVDTGQFASVSEYIRHAVRLALKSPAGTTNALSEHSAQEEIGGSTNEFNPWLTGKVQRGQQLGGKLGFPTLNLDPTLLPATLTHGVYAAQVEYDDQIYAAATHFGPRKTLGEWKPTLEFHLLEFDQHIPGSLVRFRLLQQIRETLRFDSLDELKKQLRSDVDQVRKLVLQQKSSL